MNVQKWIAGALGSAFAPAAVAGGIMLGPAGNAYADPPATPTTTSSAPVPYEYPYKETVREYAKENDISVEEAQNIANNPASRPYVFDREAHACAADSEVAGVFERHHAAPKIPSNNPGHSEEGEPTTLEENIAAADKASIVEQPRSFPVLKLFDEEGDVSGLYKVEKHSEEHKYDILEHETYIFSPTSGSEGFVGYNVSDTLMTYGLWPAKVECEWTKYPDLTPP